MEKNVYLRNGFLLLNMFFHSGLACDVKSLLKKISSKNNNLWQNASHEEKQPNIILAKIKRIFKPIPYKLKVYTHTLEKTYPNINFKYKISLEVCHKGIQIFFQRNSNKANGSLKIVQRDSYGTFKRNWIIFCETHLCSYSLYSQGSFSLPSLILS